MKKLILVTLLTYLKLSVANAQFSEVGIIGGGAVYNGTIDITAKNFLSQTTPVFGVFTKYQITDAVSIRAQLSHTELYADEQKYPSSDWRFQRALNFKTPLTELTLTGEWHFFNFGETMSNSSSRTQYSFYVLGGVGISNFTPHPLADGNNVPDTFLPSMNVRSDNQTTVVIPIGGGLQYMLSEKLALSGEIIGRKTFSPYIDGFSMVGSTRGDYYFTGTVSLAYVFNTDLNNHSHTKGAKGLGSNCPRF